MDAMMDASSDSKVTFDHTALQMLVMDDTDLAQQVIDTFLQNTPDRLQALRTAFEKSEWVNAQNLAHLIKGSSAMIGGVALSRIARSIEHALKNNQNSSVASLLPLLDHQFAQLKTALQCPDRDA
jgi:HPt (histidine-containing phosphotransfer) domain-containing protein